MGLSATYKLDTSRQTWENNDVKSEFDYNIGTFLVSNNNNQSGQYPMTTFKVKVAYRNGAEYILDAELYVMVIDLGGSVEFLPQGNSVQNFFPIETTPDYQLYGHLIHSDTINISSFFSISFIFNYPAPEGYYYDIIVHSPRLANGATMIADVYTYTLYQ